LLAKVDHSVREKGIMRPWVDVKDFVNKIDYLLDNDDVRIKMGKAGADWVLKNCSHKVIIPKWKKLFDRLDVPIAVIDRRRTEIEWTEKYAAKEIPDEIDLRGV